MVVYGKGLKGRATRLHSLVVRSRGACENCGERDYSKLQCAHVISRRYNATRTDEAAAFCLCWKCHHHFTGWPLEFAAFVEKKLGADTYEQMKAKAQAGVKANDAFWKAECDRLSTLLTAGDDAA